MNKSFLTAFAATMLIEGVYSKDRLDPGGETYFGISRIYWPEWQGWPLIDLCLAEDMPFSASTNLQPMVRDFYRVNFWNRFRGDEIAAISEPVAVELFDTAVNLGVHKAVIYLQQALNLLNNNQGLYKDIVEDGIIGGVTLSTLQIYMETSPLSERHKIKMVLGVLNTLQGMYYVNQMRKFPKKERFRGWFLRV